MGKKSIVQTKSVKPVSRKRKVGSVNTKSIKEVRPRSLTRKEPFKIFFSHKDKDESAFRQISSALEKAYGDLIEVFIAERMPAGTKWFEKIMVQIREADLFVLVYTDPNLRWDFPIFESGVRLGYDWSDSTKPSPRIRVIRHEKTVSPSPYWGTQDIEVSNENLARIDEFLIDLHKKITGKRHKMRTLNDTGSLHSVYLSEVRHVILELLNEGSKQQLVFPPELEVNLARSTDLIDAKATANTTFAILSGVNNSECTWQELQQRLKGRCKISDDWCECFLDAVRRSASHNDPSYPLPMLRLRRDGNITELRPNITDVAAHRNGTVTVKITMMLLPPMVYEEDSHQLIEFLVGAKRLRYNAIETIIEKCKELLSSSPILIEDVYDLARHSHIALTTTLEDAYGAGYDREPCKLSMNKFGAGDGLNELFHEWDEARSVFRSAANRTSNLEATELLTKLMTAADTMRRLSPIFTKKAVEALSKYVEAAEQITKPTQQTRVSRFFGFK